MLRPADAPETIRKGRLSAPPNYMDRGTQFRLLGLVGLLFAVCYLIGKSADPATWKFFFPSEADVESEDRLQESEITRRKIDTKMPLTGPTGELDEADVVKMIPWRGAEPVATQNPMPATPAPPTPAVADPPPSEPPVRGAGVPPVSQAQPADPTGETPAPRPMPSDPFPPPPANLDDPLGPGWPTTKPATPKLIPDEKLFPGVDSQLLNEVQDDAIHRNAESPAWFNLLKVLNETDEGVLVKASVGRVGFAQLFDESAYYRGKLVTIRGTVMRAHYVQTNPNEAGVTGYYLCWLKPAGGPAAPIQVYSLELPKGFPTGMNVDAQAEFTGFFFKRLAYAAQDGLRRAPLVLAKIPKWTPPAPYVPPEPPSYALLGGLAAIAAVIGITAAVAAYRWGAQPYVDAAEMEAAAPPTFDTIPPPSAPVASNVIRPPAEEKSAG